MKTQYTDTEETRIENEVEGVRETSDSSVASRGNVKNTFKDFNEHIEEHYYDKEEINYFFDKIWHFIKKHVIHTSFFVTVLGKIKGTHEERDDYEKIKNKPISVGSIDSLTGVVNSQFESITDALNQQVQLLSERIDNIRTELPDGFIYIQMEGLQSAEDLWPEFFWEEITDDYQNILNISARVWKKVPQNITLDDIINTATDPTYISPGGYDDEYGEYGGEEESDTITGSLQQGTINQHIYNIIQDENLSGIIEEIEDLNNNGSLEAIRQENEIIYNSSVRDIE